MNDKDEIDLIELLKTIYNEKKFIIKISILSALFGVIYSISLPNMFTSSTTFIPQLGSGVKKGGSSLSGLASLAGINIGGMESSSEFPPTLYPQVVNGVPFRLDLLSHKIKVDNQEVSVKNYFLKNSSVNIIGTIKKYTIGLPSLISSLKDNDQKELINESEFYLISEQDKKLFDVLNSNLSLSINEKEGFITISYTDINKNIAAQITQIAQNLLQKKIIEFKNKSSKEMLDFSLKQYSEKKYIYEKLQDERAVFVDKNINISSSLFQNKLSRLESELNISESIVMQLASQVEQAKLQVNKNTPVFTTIEPVTIPYVRSSPFRRDIVFLYLFLGFLFSSFYILIKEPVKIFIQSIKS